MADAKQRKRAVNGSQKGGAFERLVSKQLSLWVSNGTSADLFWRSASSGARSTTRFKKTGKAIEAHASDIAPIDDAAKPFSNLFVVECKNYKALLLHQVFYAWPASTLAKWWAQAVRDAGRVSKLPMLVVKENRFEALVVLPHPIAASCVNTSALVLVPHPGVGILHWQELLNTPFDVFKARAYEAATAIDRRPTVPRTRLLGSAPHRQSNRRVPLVDL